MEDKAETSNNDSYSPAEFHKRLLENYYEREAKREAKIATTEKRITKGAWCPMCCQHLATGGTDMAMILNRECRHVYDLPCLQSLRRVRELAGATDGLVQCIIPECERLGELFELRVDRVHPHDRCPRAE